MTSCLKSLAREQRLLDTDYSYKIVTGCPSKESSLTRCFFIITKLEFISILIFFYAVTLTTCVYSWFPLWLLTFSIHPGLEEKVSYHFQLDSPFLVIFNIP